MADLQDQGPLADPGSASDIQPFDMPPPPVDDLQDDSGMAFLDAPQQLGMDPDAADSPEGQLPTPPEDENPVDPRTGSKRSRKSQRATVLYAEKPITTRLHVLEFLSQKSWWYQGQNALGFTTVLWFIFIFIMYTRAGVEESYDLHLSVAQHMENIIAHPHLSGIRVRSVEDSPLPCRCACQSSSAGMPKGPCDASAAENLVFLAQISHGLPRLTQFSKEALQGEQIDPANLGDKLEAGNDDIESVSWDRITQPDDVYFWVEHGFIPDVWRARSQSAGNITLQGLVAQKNLIIGGVRVRQKRAQWSPVCESKVSKKLTDFYRTDCRSSEDASGSYGPHIVVTPNMSASDPVTSTTTITTTTVTTTIANSANQSSQASDIMDVMASSTNAMAFQPSTTSSETGHYDGLFDIELDMSMALEAASLCRQYNWVDGATRSVTLQSVALNAEIGMFAIIEIEFKFPSGGGVEKKVRVHTVHAVGSKIEFTDIIPELMWAGMIALLLRQELTQMLWSGSSWTSFRCRERKCLDYWLDMWCVVDWVSIFTGGLITVFWLWQMQSIGQISDKVAALPRAPFLDGPPADLPAYRAQWQVILDDLINVYERKQYYQLALFWYALILTARFLKGFLSQAKLSVLQLTVGTVFWDLCHLLIFFATIFLNFQLGGHLLFGAQVEQWSTMVAAGSTTVRFMLGNYQLDPMYEVHPFAAVCWFWCFLLTVVFILMNLIFAMVADYYHVIRNSIGATDTLWHDTVKSVKDLWWRLGWRRINVADVAWCDDTWNPYQGCKDLMGALCEDPYTEVLDGLMEASEVPDSLVRDADHSCLGVRIGRRKLEASSVEGLNAMLNPGFVEATSKDLQHLNADMMVADHLLVLAQPDVMKEAKAKNESELSMVRHFVHLLRNHRSELETHCSLLEGEVTDDHSTLVKHVDTLVESVGHCLGEFDRLKEHGVHSLAPPLQALPRPGTMAAREAQQQSLVAPGALLRAIDISAHPENIKAREQAVMGSLEGVDNRPGLNLASAASAMLMNSPNNAAMYALSNASSPDKAFDRDGAFQLQDVPIPPTHSNARPNLRPPQAALPDNVQPALTDDGQPVLTDAQMPDNKATLAEAIMDK